MVPSQFVPLLVSWDPQNIKQNYKMDMVAQMCNKEVGGLGQNYHKFGTKLG